MAEFCSKCWNKMEYTDYNEREASLTRKLYLCEGCGEYKKVLTDIPYRYQNIKRRKEPPIKVFIKE